MYSLVFAADMYATVFKADPLDPARGQKYREKILRVGGSRDDIDSLKVSDIGLCATTVLVLTLCLCVRRTSWGGNRTRMRL